MNSFEYGFFSELEKIAAVEDGTLATRGRLVKYENDQSSVLRARRSGKYPLASANRRFDKLNDIDQTAEDHGAIGAILGTSPGVLTGGALGAVVGNALPGSSDLGAKAGLLGGIPAGYILGGAAGHIIGRGASEAAQNLAGAARVLRANTYVRNRAAREAQGLGNKVRAFINPGRA